MADHQRNTVRVAQHDIDPAQRYKPRVAGSCCGNCRFLGSRIPPEQLPRAGGTGMADHLCNKWSTPGEPRWVLTSNWCWLWEKKG